MPPVDALLEIPEAQYLFTDKPPSYQPYFNRLNAVTTYEKYRAIIYGKMNKTMKLMKSRHKHGGVVPKRLEDLCKKTICGRMRLWVVYRN